MSKEKPKWWPENPYPKSVFPMEDAEYLKIVPDPKIRTALSGCLGRRFWETASETIHDNFKEYVEPEIDQLRAELAAYRWIPVTERLPKLNEKYHISKDVWVVWKNLKASFAGKGFYDHTIGWTIYGHYRNPREYQDQITHWMPIPPLPEKAHD